MRRNVPAGTQGKISMNAQKTAQIESLLGRPLGVEEKERLRRIKDTLHISDNDAMWDILTAMEYQRKYYEELPEQITLAAAEIFKELSVAAEKEVALAQSRLAESVVEQAEKLSLKTHIRSWLAWGGLALFLLLLYGALLLWAGYRMVSGQTHPPALVLRMPVGIIMAGLCVAGGFFFGAMAAKNFASGHAVWKKWRLYAVGLLLPSGILFALTLF